jgi:hypothetical protein
MIHQLSRKSTEGISFDLKIEDLPVSLTAFHWIIGLRVTWWYEIAKGGIILPLELNPSQPRLVGVVITPLHLLWVKIFTTFSLPQLRIVTRLPSCFDLFYAELRGASFLASVL